MHWFNEQDFCDKINIGQEHDYDYIKDGRKSSKVTSINNESIPSHVENLDTEKNLTKRNL